MRWVTGLNLMIVMILVMVGCATTRLHREYDETGIRVEDIHSSGVFNKRAGVLDVTKSENDQGKEDYIRTEYTEDPGPGVEALKEFNSALDKLIKVYFGQASGGLTLPAITGSTDGSCPTCK